MIALCYLILIISEPCPNYGYEPDHEEHSIDDLYHDDAAESDILGESFILGESLLEMDRDADRFFDDLESLRKPIEPIKPVKRTTPNSPKK